MCMYVSNSQGDMLTSSVTTSSHLHLGQPSSKAFNFTIPSCVYGLLFLLSGLVDLLELYCEGIHPCISATSRVPGNELFRAPSCRPGFHSEMMVF